MSILKFDEVPYEQVNERVKRKLIHTENLMTVIVDFEGGPWPDTDPPHNHPHEQTSYIAEGEIVFYCEGEPDQAMKAGDMFAVPPYKMHSIKLLSKTARLVDSFNPVREDFLK
ncbi:cupin domain-containing protein [Maribellus sediminis]|uniref:cupin domain-containing protein n=1 Tax=Maribellus sediminis TaxID=2696285 RepID=UPI00142F5168|nr:cupin domain-containing protein [Maribellus sediminis]